MRTYSELTEQEQEQVHELLSIAGYDVSVFGDMLSVTYSYADEQTVAEEYVKAMQSAMALLRKLWEIAEAEK